MGGVSVKRRKEVMADQNRPQDASAPLSGDAAEMATVDLTEEDFAAGAPSGEEALRAEINELNDRILRLAAELDNTRRRAEREKAEIGRYAISNFARDLLTIVDTFQRALAAAPAEGAEATAASVTALVEGLKMTDRELIAVLERFGVRRIDPKGEKFDPNLHQAVAQIPGDQPAGFVQEVAQSGFMIGDRVLRAAMVIVSTGPAAADSMAGQ
jgi:molecular chaperone GrpE